MALSRWDENDFFSNPFRGLLDPRVVVPSLLTAPPTASEETAPIRVDVLEKDDKFLVKADIPGVPKEKVKLSVDGDLLSLSVEDSAQKEKEEKVRGYKVHRIERSSTFARRLIRMPDSADTEKISAKVNSGVLEVEIPKKQAAQHRKRQIEISSEEHAEKS